ncbi:hypothetical protein S40288_11723 [Stachybotrys chartarum IBT 40288]|nr:hypothetical protein S40288_11723 [Stachybotrys chartarum IBT 40288]
MASSGNAPITPVRAPASSQKELLLADVAALKQALREKQKALTTVMRKEKQANLDEQATEGSGDALSVPEDAKHLLRELADQASTSDQEESGSSDESEGSSESKDSVEDEDEEMED